MNDLQSRLISPCAQFVPDGERAIPDVPAMFRRLMVFETYNNIVYTGEMTMGGKKIATKTVISDRTPTSYTLSGYANDGSGEKKTMTIKFTKKEPEAKPAKK